MCRNFEAIGDQKFDGVITVHSPNLGASIATSVNNGKAEAFLSYLRVTIEKAVNAANYGLSAEITAANTLVGLFNNLIDGLNSILDSLFSALGSSFGAVLPPVGEVVLSSDEILEQISSAFGMLSDPTTQTVIDDLDPTNGFISGLNAFSSTLPRIEVHGSEKDHEVLRLGCSFSEKVWLSPLTLTTPIPDDCLIEDLDKANNQLKWVNVYIIAKAVLNTGNIFRIKRTVGLYQASGDIGDARDLLKGDLESGWNDLLGTQWVPVTTTQNVFSQQCQSQIDQSLAQLAGLNQQLAQCQSIPGQNCGNILSVINTVQNNILYLQGSPNCWENIQVTTYVPVDNSNAPNDGYVLEAEQTTGATGVTTYQNREVNHTEVLNHPEMWNNFNSIFDGNDWFNTPPR